MSLASYRPALSRSTIIPCPAYAERTYLRIRTQARVGVSVTELSDTELTLF